MIEGATKSTALHRAAIFSTTGLLTAFARAELTSRLSNKVDSSVVFTIFSGWPRMDKSLSTLLNSSEILENRRVDQIVGICGSGSLTDGSKCSKEFREFL